MLNNPQIGLVKYKYPAFAYAATFFGLIPVAFAF